MTFLRLAASRTPACQKPVRIPSIVIQVKPDGQGHLLWSLTPFSSYTVSSKINSSKIRPSVWKKVWKPRAWPKTQLFLWSSTHDKFLPREQLCIRGWSDIIQCIMCGDQGETGPHVLQHRQFSSEIWENFCSVFSLGWDMPFTIRELLTSWQHLYPESILLIIWEASPAIIT